MPRVALRPHRAVPWFPWLAVLALTLGCAGPRVAERDTHLGPPVRVGEGTARAFVRVDAAGAPAAIGVLLTEDALRGLPPEPPPGEDRWEYVLWLPRKAAGTGYDHVTLDWNPRGHTPPGVYDVPHFDVHFYLISAAARARITAQGEDLARTRRQPAVDLMPAGYVLPPGTEVPGMGAHAINPAADEFHRRGFTRTFIYGFYDGWLVFLEPMVSKAFLEGRPDVTEPVAVPARYAAPGQYPTRWSIRYEGARKTYTIALEGLRRAP